MLTKNYICTGLLGKVIITSSNKVCVLSTGKFHHQRQLEIIEFIIMDITKYFMDQLFHMKGIVKSLRSILPIHQYSGDYLNHRMFKRYSF